MNHTTKSAQFTPGPRIERTPGNWTVQHNNNDDTTYIVANDPRLGADMVAEIYRVSAYEGNASLIAAAPAMYEALHSALNNVDRLGDVRSAYRATWIKQVTKLLAQAEGQHHE